MVISYLYLQVDSSKVHIGCQLKLIFMTDVKLNMLVILLVFSSIFGVIESNVQAKTRAVDPEVYMTAVSLL